MAGAIPIIRPLRESLVGDEITAVIGIVNGTANFILDKMDAAGAGFAETWPRRRSWGTPRPTRPPTSRASTPPPRPRSWPAASTRGSPVPMSTARASPRSPPPTSPRPPRSAAWSSCWPSASCYPPATSGASARCRCGAPGDDPAHRGVGGAYNAVFVESTSAGRLMFYGPGPAARRRRVRSSAIWSPWPGTGSAAPSARGVELRRAPGGPDRPRADPLPPVAGRRRRGRGAGPDRRRVRRARRLHPDRAAVRAGRGRPAGRGHPPGAGRRAERHRRPCGSCRWCAR